MGDGEDEQEDEQILKKERKKQVKALAKAKAKAVPKAKAKGRAKAKAKSKAKARGRPRGKANANDIGSSSEASPAQDSEKEPSEVDVAREKGSKRRAGKGAHEAKPEMPKKCCKKGGSTDEDCKPGPSKKSKGCNLDEVKKNEKVESRKNAKDRAPEKAEDKNMKKRGNHVEVDEKEKERKARQSRKSSAYVKAKNAAIREGKTKEEAIAAGKAATWIC